VTYHTIKYSLHPWICGATKYPVDEGRVVEGKIWTQIPPSNQFGGINITRLGQQTLLSPLSPHWASLSLPARAVSQMIMSRTPHFLYLMPLPRCLEHASLHWSSQVSLGSPAQYKYCNKMKIWRMACYHLKSLKLCIFGQVFVFFISDKNNVNPTWSSFFSDPLFL
jgi:hypothetical protein